MTTGERLAKLEQQVSDVCTNVGRIEEKLDKFIESADKKYAPSWVKDLVWTILVFIILAFVGAISTQIGWK